LASEIIWHLKSKKDFNEKRSSSSDGIQQSASGANLSGQVKQGGKEQALSPKDIDALISREIQNLNDERIRKKSEKMAAEGRNMNAMNSKLSGMAISNNNVSALANNSAGSNSLNKSDESDDYIDLKDCTSKKVTLKDFNIVKLVGKGSFGKVNNLLFNFSNF
jgi:hypothetical protein